MTEEHQQRRKTEKFLTPNVACRTHTTTRQTWAGKDELETQAEKE